MTQCFGETIIGMMIRQAQKNGINLKMVCPETRPFLQGARFTASCARDMGVDVTVITDNMPAFYMEHEKIDLFTSAADVICMDGSIINKVGTLQIAICAKYFNVPYYCTGIPDLNHPDARSVDIEFRDPEETLSAHHIKHTLEGVKGYYPAFDITPPSLVSEIITDQGSFLPDALDGYKADQANFYNFAV
ncbi:initiation factor, subunit 2 family protein [Peptoniphilus sp. oral taxon 375 str. F0436]|nr:initiation factor, subunit 2 family protein [Peptoniphilus sp. oral taxon 375 str. F0436]